MSMRDIWNGPALWRLLWPLIVEQILALTMGVADTIMVSFVGEAAVSGVSLVDAISQLLIIAFTSLCTGGSVVVSQYLGRRDSKNASASARQLLYVSLITALGISIPALVFNRSLLLLIYGRLDADVLDAAVIYFYISALSYLSLAVYNAGAALFRCMGNSRLPMLITALVNAINIGGNAFFIYVLRWGVAGAAISTFISRTLAAVILMALLIRGRHLIVNLAGITKVKFDKRILHSILRIGIPSGVEGSLFQVGKLLVSRIAASFGTSAVAANAITGTINSFSISPGNAFGIALVTIVGQCVGAKEFDNARFFNRRLLTMTYGLMVVLSIATMIFIDPVISLFHLSAESHAYTRSFLGVLCVMIMIAWPSAFTLPNSLRAAGDAKYVMYVAIISMWTIRVAGAYLCCYIFGFGPIGIWYAWTADWVLRSICFHIRWHGGKWKQMHVL
jgi:putative MATE family efflux protein